MGGKFLLWKADAGTVQGEIASNGHHAEHRTHRSRQEVETGDRESAPHSKVDLRQFQLLDRHNCWHCRRRVAFRHDGPSSSIFDFIPLQAHVNGFLWDRPLQPAEEWGEPVIVHRHIQLVHEYLCLGQDQILGGGGFPRDLDVQEVRSLLAVVRQNHGRLLLAKHSSFVLMLFRQHGAICAIRQLADALDFADQEAQLLRVSIGVLDVVHMDVTNVEEEELMSCGHVVHEGHADLAEAEIDFNHRLLVGSH
mmetsp:Transcript_78620/g.188628  ORF Transcript_78620/g.188628 Transcript_78620/m.188628 type:complete len:251 (+) Transcript_78620:1458-2210(+)